jgi:xanthine dehydrogenase accessory factor
MATLYETLRDCLRTASPAGLATIVSGPGTGSKLLVRPGHDAIGTLGDPELDRVATRDAMAELEAGRTGTRHYGPRGETIPADETSTATISVFVESFAPPPTMVIFGAVDFTAALAKVAKVLGYRVIVCDAREVFATPRRFPMADEIIVDWPNRVLDRVGPGLGTRDAVCVLTHDPKFDVPAIQGALRSRVGYIGVMGSRKTHQKRTDRLAEVGITDATDLARLHAPIGLDLGARTPEETAVSICAEIIAARTGRQAPGLRDGTGPIH